MSDQGTAKSLPFLCFEAADGDPLLALLLALDYIEKFGGSGPRVREAALDTSSHLTAPAHALPHGAPPDSLEAAA